QSPPPPTTSGSSFLLCGNPIPTTTESTESQKLSKASWFTSGQQSCLSNRISTGISVLAPNSRSLYTPLGTPAHKYFLWPSPGLGTESRLCECEPPTAGRGLPIWFCQTPLPPLLVWIDFPAPTASAIPPEATAQRSAGAYCQTTVSSDGSPPTAANNSGHVSPAVHPSLPAAAASWSATSSRFAWATPAAATNCPSCKPAGSAPVVPGLSGNDDNSVASSSPLAFPL